MGPWPSISISVAPAAPVHQPNGNTRATNETAKESTHKTPQEQLTAPSTHTIDQVVRNDQPPQKSEPKSTEFDTLSAREKADPAGVELLVSNDVLDDDLVITRRKLQSMAVGAEERYQVLIPQLYP
jgi:hypothetical protein